MSLAPPPPISTNPVLRLADDLRRERRAGVPFPLGETTFSPVRTRRFAQYPLPLLLEAYERYGPVFTLRIFHGNVVFMLGPEANHYVTVAHADNFRWRDGHMGELIPLLGDGLLTIDGEFHRRSRKAMLPVFHRERIAKATETILEEARGAVDALPASGRLDLYRWTRRLALRIAMRALFGLDPDRAGRGFDAARAFEDALQFYSRDYWLQVARGPGSPWRRMQRARAALDRLIFDEIARRRATGERGDDLLSLLLDARDEDGQALDDAHVRDEVMTLLFAGHDTTTSTVAFLFHELSGNPDVRERLEAELDAAGPVGPEHLTGSALPYLEMTIDETLRKYPPAWVGPRRSVRPFTFAGVQVPGDAFVNYCSWASHHLPHVFPEPKAFRPERFAPDARANLPKGAYVPFGGGSRTCIGMRFGQVEVRAIAALLAGRLRLAVPADYRLRIRQMPTIGPRDGLPVDVARRAPAPAAARAAA
ncbi:MAG TPA: cytochrome P450 [Solirubrobacteraceae bacterium]|jgi:cytochrome P450|nr:cytochrome P450 [Solirubrobacteraceae bacterium]